MKIIRFVLWVGLGIVLILISGCTPQYPFTPVPSVSQVMIDLEVERISAWNEALRKLKAKGCGADRLIMTDQYVDSNGHKYFEYECETNDGLWVKLRKFQDRWVIHGE